MAVRHIGGVELSGIYSSITLFGKIVYFGATSISTILLPIVARKEGQSAYNLLKKTLIVVVSITTIGLVTLNWLDEILLCWIFGKAYSSAGEFMPYVSLFSFAIGIMTILMNFFVGVNCIIVLRNLCCYYLL